MVSTSYRPLTPAFGRKIDIEIAPLLADLVSTRFTLGRTEVALPIFYPSGSHVVISIYMENGTFLVTDDGLGSHEAEMAGVSQSAYSRIGKSNATESGAGFDTRAFFFLRVPGENLSAAVGILANVVRDTVATVILNHAKLKQQTVLEAMYQTIDRTFSGRKVVHEAELRGSSNVDYRVDALVHTEHGAVVFDVFNSHPNSVSALVSKFYDISLLEDAPKRVGVVKRKSTIGERLSLVSSVGSIIEASSSEKVYLNAAA